MDLFQSPVTEDNIKFDDDECRAHSTAYFCQPVETTTTTTQAIAVVEVVAGAETTVTGNTCSGNDCTSTATCPSGSGLIKCSSNPVNGGDGLVPSATACVARGADSNAITAIATCKAGVEYVVAQSNDKYLDAQDVKATCSEGEPVGCYCHSAWIKCNSKTYWDPEWEVCEQYIGSSGGRRRGVDSGAGARIYALCQVESGPEYELKDRSTTCDDDQIIDSRETCMSAWKTLGLNANVYDNDVDVPTNPQGCFVNENSNTLYFNKAASGPAKDFIKPVCQTK